MYSYSRINQQKKSLQPGEIIFHFHLVSAENYSLIMEWNLKNELFNAIAEQLGVERRIYTPPYRPQSNGHIEGFHNFLKACLSKHISRDREWDDVTLLAPASYNWLPNQHSRESPFFVMFGRDALTNLQHLIKPKLRYMGTSELILDLETMSNIYQVQIHNLKLARQ